MSFSPLIRGNMRRGSAAMATMPPAQISAPGAGATRKDFTDKLGVSADASNAEALAALDARLAARKTSAATTSPQPNADDLLYQQAFGTSVSTAVSVDPATQRLYDTAFGRPGTQS